MTKNTQEYINNLLNKNRTPYLDLSSSCQVSTCSHCNKKEWKKNDPKLEGEIEDLSEFQNLRGINASNNNFTRLEGLFSLPNKDKLEKINLFGNKISEVDLSKIFTEFPKLKYLNLTNNPLSARNLDKLTSEQLEKFADGLKNQTIKISMNQGTILADLLALCSKKGNSSVAHKLQEVIQERNSSKNEPRANKIGNALFIFGGIAVVSFALLVGYLVGKRRKEVLE